MSKKHGKNSLNNGISKFSVSTSPTGSSGVEDLVTTVKDESRSLNKSPSCLSLKDTFQSKPKLSQDDFESSAQPRKHRKESNWTKIKKRYVPILL